MATYARADSLYGIGLQELGEAILRETLRDAAKVFLACVTGVYEAQAIHDSVLLVNGSGLEAIIQTFGLSFDAETLRERFNWTLRHVAWSSATTLDGHSWKGAWPVSHAAKGSPSRPSS